MPGRNGTGPEGAGPMTGRAMGYCRSRGGNRMGYANRNFSRARGRGFGCFAGFGFAADDSQSEIQTLKKQLEQIQSRIDQLQK